MRQRRGHNLRGLQQHAKEREPGSRARAERERKEAPMKMRPYTERHPEARGRVATRDELTGLRMREFHPADWIDPNPVHCWYICDPTIPEDAETIALMKRQLEGQGSHWYVDGELVWKGPIWYDAAERPVLFIIGNVK